MKLAELENKKILILGFGKEGRDNFRFLRKIFPYKVLGVGDRLKIKDLKFKIKDKKIRWHLGENYLKSLKNYDVIIKSPGIPFKILPKSALGKITTQTEIFFENCPGKIIGVAGTKGKSTTTALIYQILKQNGFKARLAGNIGRPILSFLFNAKPDNLFVYELSSFQLMNLKKSPHIAVLLNTFPDHLDYHKNFKEYVQANANIARYQSKNDFLIYNSEDNLVRQAAKISKAKKIPINTGSIKKIIKIKDIPLKGEFNLKNVAAAMEVGKIFGIPAKKIRTAIKKFKPLAHRLELAGVYQGIKFYNDSLSVTPETTIAAIKALGDNVETILLGGLERHLDFTKLAKEVLKSKIKNIILFPTTGEKIWKVLARQNKGGRAFNHFFIDGKKNGAQYMEEAVKLAYQHTKKGKICLLSAASASFNLFKDYEERGNLFGKYVKKYGYGKKI